MVDKSIAIPQGSTHRYEHGSDVDWYRETSAGLYRWMQGSWCASVHKGIKALVDSCPLGKLTPLVMGQAGQDEDYLTFLARNVHKWPASTPHVVSAGDELFEHGAVFCEKHIRINTEQGGRRILTKLEWTARRAELQNKPSWESAPEWATFLSQDEDGVWYWHGKQPKPKGETVTGEKYWVSCGESMPNGRGDLLGDWRDTLERRPADLSEQAVTKRLQEATDNVLAAVPELKSDKYKFEPFTGIEDNQEKVMKQDNGWHERGELPPVGTKCECRKFGSFEFREVLISGIGEFSGVSVAFYEIENSGSKFTCSSAEYFRPIRTERDVLIDAVHSATIVSVHSAEAIPTPSWPPGLSG